MFAILLRLPLVTLSRIFNYPLCLPFSWTFSLSYQCNSKCKSCDIWNIQHRVPRSSELMKPNWLAICDSLQHHMKWLTISGGEPFLHKDIVEIAVHASRKCRLKVLNIPTNALKPPQIATKISQILDGIYPATNLVINISVDGFAEQHDEIRGVAGNYKKCQQLMTALKKIKDTHPSGNQLTLGVHTVASKWNAVGFDVLLRKLRIDFSPDQLISEIAEERVEMENSADIPTPVGAAYKKVSVALIDDLDINNYALTGYIPHITARFRRVYYKYVSDMYNNELNRVIPSYAGFANAHVSPTGEIWNCAVAAKSMGNAKAFDFNMRALFITSRARKVRALTKSSHCCPLANENYTNMLLDFRTIAKVLMNRVT